MATRAYFYVLYRILKVCFLSASANYIIKLRPYHQNVFKRLTMMCHGVSCTSCKYLRHIFEVCRRMKNPNKTDFCGPLRILVEAFLTFSLPLQLSVGPIV